MKLNPNAKLPEQDVLKWSMYGVLKEINKSFDASEQRRLRIIYNELKFIIQSV